MGVDTDFLGLAFASARVAADASFVCADARRLPFADGTFTMTLSSDVLPYVTQKRTVVDEMRRVSTADAVLVCTALRNRHAQHVHGGEPLSTGRLDRAPRRSPPAALRRRRGAGALSRPPRSRPGEPRRRMHRADRLDRVVTGRSARRFRYLRTLATCARHARRPPAAPAVRGRPRAQRALRAVAPERHLHADHPLLGTYLPPEVTIPGRRSTRPGRARSARSSGRARGGRRARCAARPGRRPLAGVRARRRPVSPAAIGSDRRIPDAR